MTPFPTPLPLRGHPEALAPLEATELARAQRPANSLPERTSPFSGTLWVGLYGTPGSRGLGILGTAPALDTVTMTLKQAQAYQDVLTDTLVVPYFHMVTTIADPFPGEDGDYNHHVSTRTLELWLDVAQAHGVRSVLDLQPAHAPITGVLALWEPYLRRPGVHLAIDPEFVMSGTTSIPGDKIGIMTGQQLNLAQAWLDRLAAAVGERKVLIVHQFDNRMWVDKHVIRDYPFVDLVWDADGFGGPYAKISDYVQYAAEPGFEYGGFKLFYDYDEPVMTPAQVLGLRPRPVLVMYQ